MSEDTNGSAATGMEMEQRQKMWKEMIDLKMTSVSFNSTDLACQKMKVTAEEQEDLLVSMELPAEEEKLDGFGVRGKEANLHSDCERALQNLVLGGNPKHSMKITREVFRYQVRSGSRSSASADFDPSDILHGSGG